MSTDPTKVSELLGTPILPQVEQHAVKPTDPVVGTVHATYLCTTSRKAASFVRHIEIDVSGTPLENSWHSGQSFGVIAPGTQANGNPHKLRLYSISAPTKGEGGKGKIITTTVKRVLDEHWDTHKLLEGVCSNYLCDLNVGDKVMLTGPVGKRFLLPENPADHDYIFIATGTGIAPFRSMILDLINLGMPSEIALLMGVPYESDLLYDETFKGFANTYNNFTYHTAVSRHLTSTQDKGLYVQDRLSEDADRLSGLLASERTLIYICGLGGMELGVFQKLAELLPPDQLAQYLWIDPEIADDIDNWERRMIPKKIKKTKRVFLEVY